MLLCRSVAQRARGTRIGLTKVGLCTPATCTLMTNIENVSETSALTHYWSAQAPGKIPTQLPLSLTPSSLSCPTTLQYVCWRHVSAIERVLRWPPASFKRPHPGPIITFYTHIPLYQACNNMHITSLHSAPKCHIINTFSPFKFCSHILSNTLQPAYSSVTSYLRVLSCTIMHYRDFIYSCISFTNFCISS
jgi:hypothetical protein